LASNNANHLADGVSERVLVFRYDEGLKAHSVCENFLKSPGLRGAIIGYSDRVVASWKSLYVGKEFRAGLGGTESGKL